MRTRIVVFIALVSMMFTVIAQAHGGHGKLKWDSNDWKRCSLPYRTDAQVKKLIACGVDHFPTSKATALRVAQCESGYEAHVYNGSCCGGVFQQHLRYWSGRVANHNRAVGDKMDVQSSWRNGRSNVLVSIRMAHRYGWSGNWSCY